MSKEIVNKCVVCGKFRKFEELDFHWEPDTHFNSEQTWAECKMGFGCQKEEEAK